MVEREWEALPLGRFCPNRPIVMLSINPGYARPIESGQKKVEFRKRFSKQILEATAIIYVTRPTQQIRMVADILQIHRGSPFLLWQQFERVAGVSRAEFDAYFGCQSEGVGLALSHVQVLKEPIELSHPLLQALQFRPPQSFNHIKPTDLILPLINQRLGG